MLVVLAALLPGVRVTIPSGLTSRYNGTASAPVMHLTKDMELGGGEGKDRVNLFLQGEEQWIFSFLTSPLDSISHT